MTKFSKTPANASLLVVLVAASMTGCSQTKYDAQQLNSGSDEVSKTHVELLNASYDPTRELWRNVNERFVDAYRQDAAREVTIRQSHGGSSSQARAVIDGLEADVVTLAIWSDVDVSSARAVSNRRDRRRMGRGKRTVLRRRRCVRRGL